MISLMNVGWTAAAPPSHQFLYAEPSAPKQNAPAVFRWKKCPAYSVTKSGGFPSLQPTLSVATENGGQSSKSFYQKFILN